MKHIVIYKTNNPSVDFSCEHIIRFTAKLYKYSDKNIISGKNFIIARIPDKIGDMSASQKFFDLCDMVQLNPPEHTPYDKMEEIVKRTYINKIDVGHSLILATVRGMLDEDSYMIY